MKVIQLPEKYKQNSKRQSLTHIVQVMDHSPINQNFELNKSRQNFNTA